MLERVAAVPGVHGVASALDMPFTGDGGRVAVLADGVGVGSDDADTGSEAPLIRANIVSTNYFEVLGIPLVSGRTFDRGDRADSLPAAVISVEAGNRIWPGVPVGDLVGRSLAARDGDERLYRVIGVVGDIYNRGLRNSIDPILYLDYHQSPFRFATLAARRGAGDPRAGCRPLSSGSGLACCLARSGAGAAGGMMACQSRPDFNELPDAGLW